MAKRIRVRGILTTSDAVPGLPIVLIQEGTETVVSVTANDILSVDSYQISHAGVGFALIYFSDDGTQSGMSTIYRAISALAPTNITWSAIHEPMTGIPGDTVWIFGVNDDTINIVITGYVYKA